MGKEAAVFGQWGGRQGPEGRQWLRGFARRMGSRRWWWRPDLEGENGLEELAGSGMEGSRRVGRERGRFRGAGTGCAATTGRAGWGLLLRRERRMKRESDL